MRPFALACPSCQRLSATSFPSSLGDYLHWKQPFVHWYAATGFNFILVCKPINWNTTLYERLAGMKLGRSSAVRDFAAGMGGFACGLYLSVRQRRPLARAKTRWG